MRVLVTLILALACSGCRRESGPAHGQAGAAQQQSYGERVAALPDPRRRAVFLRAVRDAGFDCQHVESATVAGRYRDLPVWRATCRGGSEGTVVITNGGVAQILQASEAGLVMDD